MTFKKNTFFWKKKSFGLSYFFLSVFKRKCFSASFLPKIFIEAWWSCIDWESGFIEGSMALKFYILFKIGEEKNDMALKAFIIKVKNGGNLLIKTLLQ